MNGRVVALLALSGCGRLAFEPVTTGDGTVDGAGDGTPGPRDAPFADAPAIYSTAKAYWRFEEGIGIESEDVTGGGHPMQLANGVGWTRGVSGGAVSSTGSSEFMASTLINFTLTQGVTVSAWVRRTYSVGPRHTLFELSADFNSVDTGFGFFPDDTSLCATGLVMLGTHGAAGYSANCYTQPSSGVWHHIVAVYDKSLAGNAETALYIDGVLQTPVASPFTADNTELFGDHLLYVFSRGGVEEYNAGEVDELAIFARALTPAEIAQL